MALSLAMLAAILFDRLLGEPRRLHPLVGFGALATRVGRDLQPHGRIGGVLAVALLVLLPGVATALAVALLPAAVGWMVAAVLASLCIAARSLREHGQAVAAPLAAGDLPAARRAVARLVSRETAAMDAAAIRRAVIESLLENASDGVFASLFWFAIGGLVGGPAAAAALVVGHRLANTLDAMWGYRTPAWRRFGWAAARLDDLLNWLPARASAASLALVGDRRAALACWRAQAGACDSPNAGPVMSAGAGALGLRLGGAARYHGQQRARPELGCGAPPADGDVRRALALIGRALVLWCAVIVGLDVVL
ncbi:adenosylcobinamide-phosphate synthase CbiB [Salinisphaera orenii]|uniref:adenosylcobinamide-phosphate synthase CbiB n=1 Tax=Salinisphaera orenii TaxID=856731 RepID=UPI00319E8DB4